ncbi:DUF4097 domain-containing protein [Balneola sp. MJW-20]|uniref:DUF4097 family beta strand repeat-containing protein n=1 Tax=Gracilimonas aurantiaca TaxID=3234185 RepID=UPI003467B8FB
MSVLILVFSVNELSAQNGPAYRTETFRAGSSPEINVRTSGGSIEVNGYNGSEIKVDMYVRRRGEWMEAGEADLSNYEIRIVQEGNKVIAEARQKNNFRMNRRNNYSISFVVQTPVYSQTDLRTSGGSVSVSKLEGTQDLRTSGGSVSAVNVEGDVQMNTSGGSVNIQAVTGRINARTSGGTIRAEDVQGDIELRTSGGSISISGIKGSVDARTSGGSIDADISEPGDLIELKTSGGSIDLRVPGNRGYNLDLDGSRVNTELSDFTGRSDRGRIEGTIKGGGTLIEAKTSAGSVNLRYF